MAYPLWINTNALPFPASPVITLKHSLTRTFSIIRYSPPFCAKILTEKIMSATKDTAVTTSVSVVTSYGRTNVAQAEEGQSSEQR